MISRTATAFLVILLTVFVSPSVRAASVWATSLTPYSPQEPLQSDFTMFIITDGYIPDVIGRKPMLNVTGLYLLSMDNAVPGFDPADLLTMSPTARLASNPKPSSFDLASTHFFRNLNAWLSTDYGYKTGNDSIIIDADSIEVLLINTTGVVGFISESDGVYGVTHQQGSSWFYGSDADGGNYGGNAPRLQLVAQSAAVPLPTAAWLLGSGLLGLIGVARRKLA